MARRRPAAGPGDPGTRYALRDDLEAAAAAVRLGRGRQGDPRSQRRETHGALGLPSGWDACVHGRRQIGGGIATGQMVNRCTASATRTQPRMARSRRAFGRGRTPERRLQRGLDVRERRQWSCGRTTCLTSFSRLYSRKGRDGVVGGARRPSQEGVVRSWSSRADLRGRPAWWAPWRPGCPVLDVLVVTSRALRSCSRCRRCRPSTSGESEVEKRRGIRANLDPLSRRARRMAIGISASNRAIARRLLVGEHGRALEARDEPLLAAAGRGGSRASTLPAPPPSPPPPPSAPRRPPSSMPMSSR